MRFLDLALAALIGTSALASIAVVSPDGADRAYAVAARDSALWDAIASSVRSVGLQRLGTSASSEVCALLNAQSDANVTLSAEVDGFRCSLPPPHADEVELTVVLPLRNVTIEAW